MQVIRKSIFKQFIPNTFIGGVASNTGSIFLMAQALNLNTDRIRTFNIVGNDTQFAVTGAIYGTASNGFRDNYLIKYFYDNDGLVTSFGTNSFRSSTIEEVIALNCITVFGQNATNSGAFQSATALRIFTSNSLTTIGFFGFFGCVNLEYLNVSIVTNLGLLCFQNCHKIIFNSFDSLVNMSGSPSFSECRANTLLNFPVLISMLTGNIMFLGNTALVTLNMPELITASTSLSDRGLSNCVNLVNLNINKLTTLTGASTIPNQTLGMMRNTPNFKIFNAPELTSMEVPCMFQNASGLELISCKKVQNFGFPTADHNLFFDGIKLNCVIEVHINNATNDGLGGASKSLVWVKENRNATVNFFDNNGIYVSTL